MAKAHFEALGKDAATWDGVATELETVKSSVQSIEVNRGAFSFAAMDVADTYAEVRQRVIDLLVAGAGEATGASTALSAIRTTLEANEQAAVEEFGGMWTPREI